MARGPLVKVRTGPTSYLKMTEAEADIYRRKVGEHGAVTGSVAVFQPLPEIVAGQEDVQRISEPVAVDLNGLTVAVLTERAQALGIATKGLRKADLIAAIQVAEAGDGQDGAA